MFLVPSCNLQFRFCQTHELKWAVKTEDLNIISLLAAGTKATQAMNVMNAMTVTKAKEAKVFGKTSKRNRATTSFFNSSKEGKETGTSFRVATAWFRQFPPFQKPLSSFILDGRLWTNLDVLDRTQVRPVAGCLITGVDQKVHTAVGVAGVVVMIEISILNV